MENETAERDENFERSWKDYLARERRERYESQSEMVKRGMQSKREAGGTNGRAPIGYLNKRIGKKAWVEIDPVMGPLVQEAFEMAATGRHSVRAIAAAMAAKKLTYRGRTLSHSTMHGLLTSTYYIALDRTGDKASRAAHRALITHELFGRTQDMLKKRSRRARPI